MTFDRSKSIFFQEPTGSNNSERADMQPRLLGYNSLRLKWDIDKQIRYGIRLEFKDSTGENEVKFEVAVTRRENNEEGDVFFEIDRVSEVYINELIPDLVLDKLAYKVGQVFYPLVVQLDGDGEFVSVANHQEILRRWTKIKEEVYEDFEGDFIGNYLNRMDELLQSVDQINTVLIKNDWFLNTFFRPIYKEYVVVRDEGYDRWRFPILSSCAEYYEVKEYLNAHFNHFEAIEIKHHGSLRLLDEELGEEINGEYKAQYILHPRLKHILAINGDYSYTNFGDEKNVKVNLFFNPPEGKSFDYDFEENQFIEVGNQEGEEGKKTSFWSKLFS